MRFLALLLGAAALGSCTTGPVTPNPQEAAEAQAKFAELTAGRVAGPPVTCISHNVSDDMTKLPGGAVAFRDNSRRIYINTMGPGCPNLRDQYALVTRPVATTQLCSGDIAQVVDPSTGMFISSCVFGEFVPYTKTGA